jgi:hypothetical protein
MTAPHRHNRSLAAGAALGDLAPQEQARWAGLQASCAECRSLEREVGGVLAELALVAPVQMPPPALLEGIRAAIHAEADRA